MGAASAISGRFSSAGSVGGAVGRGTRERLLRLNRDLERERELDRRLRDECLLSRRERRTETDRRRGAACVFMYN